MTAAAANFVLTLPLATTPRDESVLRTRFDAACSAYNALVGECKRRASLMRESRAWRAAGRMSKGREKTAAYRELNKRHGFREYDLYQFIRCLRAGVPFRPAETPTEVGVRTKGHVGYVGQHLDAHTVMAMGKRAFAAVKRAIFKRGDAKFARRSDFRSVQGINHKSAIKWTGSAAVWSGLTVTAMIDMADPVVRHGVESQVVLTRIVRFTIRGRDRYYVQLTCEGSPYRKAEHRPASGTVGLDLGPSTIAIVGRSSATVERFADELADREREIARLQRAESRKRFINNPASFVPGTKTFLKGGPRCKASKRQRRVAKRRAELQRREQAHRKQLHGRLVHRVLAQGDDVRTEKLSYRGFQRSFGRSVRTRAPGLFMARLRGEAAKWGASVAEFDPRPTRLSQTCPNCGAVRKKKLSERWHSCPCGAQGQRDIVSAHLARFVGPDGRLDAASARVDWQRVCITSRAALGDTNGSTGGASACAHLLPMAGREPSRVDVGHKPVSGPDAVPARKGDGRAGQKPADDRTRAHPGRDANRERPTVPPDVPVEVVNVDRSGSRRPTPDPIVQMELWSGGHDSGERG